MQAMKGATQALGSMNRTMNLPALQRIAMEFERENDIMEQRQEMMDDAIDDAMDVGVEEEGDEVVEQVLEEIGVDLSQSVGDLRSIFQSRHFKHSMANTDYLCSSEKPRLDSSLPLFRKGELPRLSAAAGETLVMTIFRRGWTACGNDVQL